MKCDITHSVPFCTNSAVSDWSGSRPLASATVSILDLYRDFCQISCCWPLAWRSCSFESAWSFPSHAPVHHRCGRCWHGSTKALFLDLGGRWIRQPANFSVPRPPELALQHCLGHRSCSHMLRANSSTHLPPRLTLLCCPVEVRLLSGVLQSVKGRDISPVLMISRRGSDLAFP